MTGPDGLPTGTVTFLFTDIEGSTRLLGQHGAAYTGLLDQHRRLLRAAFEEHGGVVFGSEGDALFVAFDQPGAAMGAAVDGQLALERAEWPQGGRVRVRMGLHTGEVALVDGDYVGMAVHVAARVAAAGHGGQALVSEVTHQLAPGCPVVDLGRHRLKDVGEVGIRQLKHVDLPLEFPPLRTLTSVSNNLPAPTDTFVGRHKELADVARALAENRLVTLTGPGGSGKTRLALEAATSVLPSFPDGVWLVPLATASEGDRVVPLVASTLRVPEHANEAISTSLDRWLRDQRALLVLDNCEHVVPAVTAMAERLLQACPQIRILATSREFLGLRGEKAMLTPPLVVPDDPVLGVESEAVELFLARSEAAVPGFDAGHADRALVAQVCRRLDGLPLAIELAAARLRALSLDQLARRLDDRFRLLGGGGRSRLPGQRTLEAVVGWSYDLLSDEERHLFRRLAVFADHFDLDAAEAVAGDEPVEDVVEVLTRLVEKSLVSIDATGPAYRYRLLETLRQYALDRLIESGELARWRDRLLSWALTRAAYVEASLRRPAQDAAIRSVTADRASLRSAMEWAMETGELVAALRIVTAVPIGLNGERREIISDLLARLGDGLDHLHAGGAYSALGNMAFEQSDWAASSEANALAVENFRLAGSDRHAAWATYLGVHSAWGAGDLETADMLLPRALRYFRSAGDQMGLGYSLWAASLRTDDLDQAKAMAAEADGLLREADVPMGVAHNVEGRGIIAFERGELADAARFVSEAVELFSSYGNLGCSAHAVEAAAVVAGTAGKGEAAVELLAAAEELRRQSGQGHRPWEIRARHGAIEERIRVGTPAALATAQAAGRRHTLRSAAAFAVDALRTVGSDVVL